MGTLEGLNYEFLEHPLYSPDLAPSDFHRNRNLRTFVPRKRAVSNEEVILAVDGYCAELL